MPDRLAPLVARLSGGPRLAVAGLLLVAGAAAALAAGTPAPRAPVVVAVRDLPAGHVLVGDDLRLVSRPTSDRPGRTVAVVAAARGARLAAAVTAGEVLTAARLVPSAFPPLGADRRRVAVTVGTATAAVVTPGDSVDVTVRRGDTGAPGDLGGSGGPAATAAVLTRGASVLAVWPGGATPEASTVVLAVDATAAGEVSVLTAADVVGLVRDGP